MLDGSLGLLLLVATLVLFAWRGLRVGANTDVEEFVVARNAESGTRLGLSFLASGVGAWILFAPPEVGATVGVVGVLGYAVAVTAPLAGLALVGRRLRTLMPAGHGLTEFVRVRFGRAVHGYVIAVSLVYMLVAVTAELTAAGSVLERLWGTDPRWSILAIVTGTLVYTAYGGLRASVHTDVWQGWLLLALLAVAVVAAIAVAPSLAASAADVGGSPLLDIDRAGIEGAVTLIIAIVVTTLFHNGYWQRVWAAEDQRALTRAALIGAATRFPVVLLIGLVGVLAATGGLDLGVPPVPFFALLAELPRWVLVVVLVLAIPLVASSVDTLENAMAALVVTERPSLGMRGARITTVALMIPVTLAAFQGYSVLRLLLLADLLCAATVVPILLGLWRRATAPAAIAGSVAGLVGAVVPGWVATGSLARGLELATFSEGLALGPFAGALVASTAVAVAVSLAGRSEVDIGALAGRVGPLTSRADQEPQQPPQQPEEVRR